MAIYDRFGVKPLINAAGTKTRLGGTRMAPEVRRAMEEAAEWSVDMAHLQAAASRTIARITGAEAGYVTSGAAAGLTLGAAACISGSDPVLIDRLPFTEGLPNEIVITRAHRNSYDHAWRAAGARLVEVGLDDRAVGSGVRSFDSWEFDAAIGEKTVAIAYVANRRDTPPLAEVVKIARRHRLPVLVDAAAQLPPVENLRRFIAAGADLVSFSGGKAIGGPQSTGILCGRRDLIQAVLLNHLDMDIYEEHWSPPEELFPDGSGKGLPRHGIGRGFKVSKENVIGLLVALERFVDGAWREDLPLKQEIAAEVCEVASRYPFLSAEASDSHGLPRVELRFEQRTTAIETLRRLEQGEPGIALDPHSVDSGRLTLNTAGLDRNDARVVVERLTEVLDSVAAAQAGSKPTDGGSVRP